MFYSQQMLAKRTGLGIVWLAATLGNRSTALKKITRRELDGINITKACESVASPSEPMALRLSSQLMYGVVRLYSQKSEQFVLDVSHVHATMRKNLSEISAATSMFVTGDQIDMVVGKKTAGTGAGPDNQLTLKPNQTFFAGDFDRAFDTSWDDFLDRRLAARAGSAAGADDDESGISSGRFDTRSPSASSGGRLPLHTAPRDRITLSSHRGGIGIGDYSSDVGAGRGLAGEDDLADFGFDAGLGLGEQDGQLDLGLGLEGLDPLPPPDPASPPRPPGAARLSADIGATFADDGVADQPMDGGDLFDLGLDNTGAALPSALRRSRSPSAAADDVAAGASPPKRQKKKKKVSFSLEDPRIELTDGDVQAQVDDYTRSMAEQYAEKEEREAARRADGWVRDMLHNAPADLANGSLLVDFWQVTVGAENERVDVLLREHRARGPATAATPQDEPAAIAGEGAQAVGEPGAGYEPMDVGDDGWQGAMDAGHDYPAEQGRRESSVIAPEVGRGPATPSASGRMQLPWLAQDTTAAGPGDLSDVLRAGQGTPGGGHRSMSISSAGGRPVLPPLGSVGGSPPGLLDDGAGRDASSSGLGDVAESIPWEQREQETVRFFDYAQQKADEVAPRPLTFLDLARIEDSTKGIAAAAFAHVLQLATNGRIEVEQEEGYGEIIIDLLGGAGE